MSSAQFCATWFEVQQYIHEFVEFAEPSERVELTEELNALIPALTNIDVRYYICEFSGFPVYSGDVQQAIQLMLSSAIPAYVKYGTVPEPNCEPDFGPASEIDPVEEFEIEAPIGFNGRELTPLPVQPLPERSADSPPVISASDLTNVGLSPYQLFPAEPVQKSSNVDLLSIFLNYMN